MRSGNEVVLAGHTVDNKGITFRANPFIFELYFLLAHDHQEESCSWGLFFYFDSCC